MKDEEKKMRRGNIIVWLNFTMMTLASIFLFLWTKLSFFKWQDGVDASNSTTTPGEAWSCILYKSRARVLPPIKFNYEYERLFVSSFLHKNRNHLLLNMLSHYLLLFSLQGYYSSAEILFTTYYSIVAGNLFSGVY